MCKSGENKSNLFMQCVQAASEPMCILATNCQLDEMVRNCTDNSNYVPIGVDPIHSNWPFLCDSDSFCIQDADC